MDFSVFDHIEHIPALTWLGKKDWMIYHDLPEKRSVSAQPRSLFLKPKEIPQTNESPLVVSEKEYRQYPSEMWRVLKGIVEVLDHNPLGTLWFDTLAKSLAGGPKIFRPSPLQCEALQNAEARYSFDDYKQPFPVIILEIPQEYRLQLKEKYEIVDAPKFVFINHDDKNKFINVSSFYSKNNIITHITPSREEYQTIEASLTKNRDRRKNEINRNEDREFEAAETVQRLGINFAMMMSLYTVKDSGPIDPSQYKIWQNDAKGKRKSGEPSNKAVEAKKKLAANINLIEFDQNVEFFDEVEENVEIAQGVDIDKLHKSPKSHWRRGHFAMQACGVGRRERKMIFRKPLLVRARYFIGEMKDSSVTYTIHPNRNNLLPPPSPEIKAKTNVEVNIVPEFPVKIGQEIQIKEAEDCPVPNGTYGKITKLINLGPNTFQIDAITEDGEKFTLICPPDDYTFQ